MSAGDEWVTVLLSVEMRLKRKLSAVFESIEQVRLITEDWLREYNEERPHDSLGRVPPLTFMPRRATLRESTSELYP